MTKPPEQPLPVDPSPQSQNPKVKGETRGKCKTCVQQNKAICQHCFVCGQTGHRAISYLQQKVSGNMPRVTGEGQPVTETAQVPPVPNNQDPKQQSSLSPKKRLAQLIGKRCMVTCALNGAPIQILLYSGAQVTLVGKTWMQRSLGETGDNCNTFLILIII